jgi:rhamnose transport system permease protein
MRPELLRRIATFRELGTVVLLVLVVVLASAKDPRFLQPTSLNGILLWIPLLVVVGIGQMMVIVTRGIDVSVGSMVGLCGMVAGMLFRENPGLGVTVGTLAAIVAGTVLGCLNGAFAAYAGIPPIIVTLGTLSAFRGLCFIVSGSRQIDSNYIPDDLTRWSLEGPIHLGGVVVPWILVIALAVAAVASWFLRMTRSGRDAYALGSNPEAARLRGVPVTRTTFMVYAVTGALCGLAGVFYASRFGFVNPATAGAGFELVVIAAVVIGGTNVTGGSGSVLGVVLGALLLAAISQALSVLGIEATWQQLVYGVVILAAIVMDTAIKRKVGEAA